MATEDQINSRRHYKGHGTHLVHVMLDNGSPNHGSGTGDETSGDPLYRSKVDAYFPEAWVYKEITYRNEDYQRKRVEIVDNVVRNAVSHHSSGLRCQVVDNLIISKPCFQASTSGSVSNARRTIKWVPSKYGTCLEATANFLNPFIIERHPRGPLAVRDVTRLGRLPEVIGLKVSVESDGVRGPSTPRGVAPKLDRFGKHGALGGIVAVPVAAKEEDDGTNQENNGRKGKGEIEAIILNGN
jgi:hypothetical protein